MSNNIEKISLSTSVFGKENGPGAQLADYVQIAREAGYEYLELSRRQFQGTRAAIPLIRASGVKIWSVHGILSMDAISEDEKIRRQAVEAAYRRAAEAAEFAPCPLVEHYLNRRNDPVFGENFRRSIEELFEKILPLGYTLCIETAPYKPKTDERYPDSLEIARFVRSFQHEKMRMTVDINHSNIKEDLVRVAQNSAGLVKNIHVSDNHGVCEEHLAPGKGVINIRRAFSALRENGYTGPCNLEFRFDNPPEPPSVMELRAVRLQMQSLLFDQNDTE